MGSAASGEKRPFDIDEAMDRIREAVRPFPKAAMFELADDGFDSPFEQLVACVISVRTRDEESVVIARRLFGVARTPDAIAALTPAEIDALIVPSTFHEQKAVTIREIARRTVEDFGGALPCDDATLQSFAGVGPKCSHLALGIACGQPVISVDIHVHRICNRWGVVGTATPEQTMTALERWLPERFRVEINRLLVPFGKHVCTGVRPRCSTCPVLDMCRQVGVEAHR
jgi:endonuclease-3